MVLSQSQAHFHSRVLCTWTVCSFLFHAVGSTARFQRRSYEAVCSVRRVDEFDLVIEYKDIVIQLAAQRLVMLHDGIKRVQRRINPIYQFYQYMCLDRNDGMLTLYLSAAQCRLHCLSVFLSSHPRLLIGRAGRTGLRLFVSVKF